MSETTNVKLRPAYEGIIKADTHSNLLELVTKLDNRSSTEFSRFVHGQNTMLKVIQLGFDQQ